MEIVQALDEKILEKIIHDASEMSWEALQHNDSDRVDVWYEDENIGLDISCDISGRMRTSGDGYNEPEVVEMIDVRVSPRIVYSEPKLSGNCGRNLLQRIKSEVEEYLTTI